MGRNTSIEAARQLPQLDGNARIISDVARRFAEVTTDYAQLLERVAQSLAESLHDLCTVFLVTPDGAAVTARSVHAIDPHALAELRAGFGNRQLALSGQPALRRLLDSGQALLIPRLVERADASPEQQRWQQRLGLHSVLLVPIRVQGRAIGALSLGRFRPESPPFQPSDQVLAQSLADHAGLAIENARLYAAAEAARRAAEEAREAVRRSEAEHLSFFESNPNPSFIVDAANLQILVANQAALRLYGYSQQEFLRLTLFQLRHAQDHDPESGLLTLVGNGATSGPARHRHKDGSLLHVEGGSHLATFEGRPARLVVLSDQSKRVQAELARDSLEEQLRQAQKLEAVGRLAGGVAHDFNNVLSVILGYSEDLLEGLDASDQRWHDLKEIETAAQRAAALTRQLLMFSRQHVLEPKVLDLNEVLANLDRMLGRLVGDQVELTLLPAADLGRIRADRGNIEQVIMNLAVNARDAMPQGGRLTIETANVLADEAFVRQRLGAKLGPYVQLSVTDTGTGIDPATKSRIFEPFFSTKEQGKGTGLGLSTVLGIVQRAGGGIWVHSEAGRGASFKVYLPRVEAELDPASRALAPTALQGTETLLLVEDDPAVREVARRVLERHGYTVLLAQSATDAVALAERYAGPLQLLLTDVMMPQLGGAQLAEQLSRSRPGLKVLYMSGYTDGNIGAHGILAPGAAFLQKPFTSELMAGKVRRVLDGLD